MSVPQRHCVCTFLICGIRKVFGLDGSRCQRAHRQWFLALGGQQHPRIGERFACRCRNRAGVLPKGAVVGTTDFLNTGATGAGGYGGPCPPQGHGVHSYTFTLFALKAPDIFQAAGIPTTGTAALTGFVLNHGLGPNVLGKASFTATYDRP